MDPLAPLLADVVGARLPVRRIGERYDADDVDTALDDFVVHARSGDAARALAAIEALGAYRKPALLSPGYPSADVDALLADVGERYRRTVGLAAAR